MREEIESNYKIILQDTLKKIEILKGEINKKEIYSHSAFVEPMLDYIVNDFENTRKRLDDHTIGAMVICDSSEQAEMMFEIFNSKFSEKQNLAIAAEPEITYKTIILNNCKVKKASLILHDVGDKEFRKELVDDFKEGKTDLLFVYNMLLTGFDAPRLKKLYLGRVIKQHNLLQALTRVNRTYNNFKYGFVVDFADITKEFDATNKAYFDELQEELGDDLQFFSDIFKSKEEIETEINELKELLFYYDLKNPENFSNQITAIQDKEQVLKIKKILENAKTNYNVIKLLGYDELSDKLDFEIINILYREANNHLSLLIDRENLENQKDNKNLLNIALEDVIFMFTKIKEEELIIADQLKETIRKTRETFVNNFDKKDPEFTTLYEEFIRIFDKNKMEEMSQDVIKHNISTLKQIHDKIKELNRLNNLLSEKYNNDKKFVRIHKRIKERSDISLKEIQILNCLSVIKNETDNQVLQNNNIVEKEAYFNTFVLKLVVNNFSKEKDLKLNPETSKYINNLIIKEYLDEFHNIA